MDSVWLTFVLALLATWRVTHLVSREDGPLDMLVKLRLRAGTGVLGRLMDCFNCLSLWVAAPFAFLVGRSALETFLSWLALSGGACLLERTERESVTVQEWPGTREEDDGLLWGETSGAAETARDRIGARSTGASGGVPRHSTTTADYGQHPETRPRADS
jgi:hypothetical protein